MLDKYETDSRLLVPLALRSVCDLLPLVKRVCVLGGGGGAVLPQ